MCEEPGGKGLNKIGLTNKTVPCSSGAVFLFSLRPYILKSAHHNRETFVTQTSKQRSAHRSHHAQDRLHHLARLSPSLARHFFVSGPSFFCCALPFCNRRTRPGKLHPCNPLRSYPRHSSARPEQSPHSARCWSPCSAFFLCGVRRPHHEGHPLRSAAWRTQTGNHLPATCAGPRSHRWGIPHLACRQSNQTAARFFVGRPPLARISHTDE